jgi:hypothetical protein
MDVVGARRRAVGHAAVRADASVTATSTAAARSTTKGCSRPRLVAVLHLAAQRESLTRDVIFLATAARGRRPAR